MKLKVLLIVCLSCLGISLPAQYYATSSSLNMDGALKLAQEAVSEARKMDKNVSVAVLDATGTTLLLLKGDGVGPHNTEASRRKAYTAVSTKNATWELMQKASADPTSTNLTTLPELLLLGGGVRSGQKASWLEVSEFPGVEGDGTIMRLPPGPSLIWALK